MRMLIMALALIATALGTAVSLNLLFPKTAQPAEASSPQQGIPLEQVLNAPLAPAPIRPGNELTRFNERQSSEIEEFVVLDEDLDADLEFGSEEEVVDLETLYQSTLAELDEPTTASDDELAEADTAQTVAAAPTPTQAPPPSPTAQPTPAATAAPTPTRVAAPAPTQRPAPAAVARATQPPRPPATRPVPTTLPAAVAWWETPRAENALGIVYIGSAAYRRAIVIMANGRFQSADSAARSIRVQQGGQSVAGHWIVSDQNASMLIFPVEAPGVYDLSLDAELQDGSGRRLGATRSGAVVVR